MHFDIGVIVVLFLIVLIGGLFSTFWNENLGFCSGVFSANGSIRVNPVLLPDLRFSSTNESRHCVLHLSSFSLFFIGTKTPGLGTKILWDKHSREGTFRYPILDPWSSNKFFCSVSLLSILVRDPSSMLFKWTSLRELRYDWKKAEFGFIRRSRSSIFWSEARVSMKMFVELLNIKYNAECLVFLVFELKLIFKWVIVYIIEGYCLK